MNPAPMTGAPDFAFFDMHAPTLRAIYRQVADANGYLSTDDYKDHPVLVSLHPALQNDDPNGIPLLGKWNKRFPNRSGLTYLRTRGNTSDWRLKA